MDGFEIHDPRFSPDGRRLYVSEAGRQFDEAPVQHIRAFDAADDGARLTSSLKFHSVRPCIPDGFRCDEHGEVRSSAGDGVHCIAPDGTLPGRILLPFTLSNLAFVGRHRARPLICISHTLSAIYTNVRGA